MEDYNKGTEFRDLLRNNLSAYLRVFGYALLFDNQNQDQSISKNWIFRLQYSGKHKIEIHNDDWRDYTEYFTLKVNEEELFILNLNNYQNIETAFEALLVKITDKI